MITYLMTRHNLVSEPMISFIMLVVAVYFAAIGWGLVAAAKMGTQSCDCDVRPDTTPVAQSWSFSVSWCTQTSRGHLRPIKDEPMASKDCPTSFRQPLQNIVVFAHDSTRRLHRGGKLLIGVKCSADVPSTR
jgi:hypothetical protein